ncbi:DUF2505 family protein [Kitasatospora sp. NPDC089509]|uniref:DUF2505 family protein n=1 Tax=Kitasatospora sp. NPDC089509 TaxID=3364079 RepID=UPI0038069B28
MGKFTTTHEFAATPERVWALFLDRAFNERFYREELGFPQWEVIEQTQTGEEVTRKVTMQPRRDLPGPVAKLLGSGFRQTEDGTFAPADGTGKWRRVPSTLADKWREEAAIRIEPVDGGRCRMTIEFAVEIKVFGVGGLMESTLEKQLREEWDHFAAAVARELG